MGEVQVAGDQIIDMVSVRHCLMSAVRAMAMSGLMPIAAVAWRASRRVLGGDVEPMFIDMVAVDMVQVSVVQIVGVAVMCDGRMAAVSPMLIAMLIMNGVVVHCRTPFVSRASCSVLS